MKKRNLKVMAMMAAAVLALSGCSGGGNTATEAPKSDSSAAATEAAADTKTAEKQQLPQITRPNPLTWLYRLPQAAT